MDLTNRIKDRISNADGKIGIYFCDINKNDSCFVGNCDVFGKAGADDRGIQASGGRNNKAGR